jgi:Xaa-Pro aminopeptidase
MFNKKIYQERRKKLSSIIKDGVILLLGNKESSMNYPANCYKFRQDSTFLYFIGINLPDLAAIIDLNNGHTTLYGNDIDIDDIIWMGPQPTMQELANLSGIENVKPFKNLFDDIEKFKHSKTIIHFLPPYRDSNKILLNELLSIPINELKLKASPELCKAVVMLRSVKDNEEIAHLNEIMSIAYKMHTTAMQMSQDGVWEQTIAGVVEGIALQNGARVSFPVILSKHGEILHNHNHSNILKNGDLLLCDAGFESFEGYATDHTRTIPVGGKFSTKQKEIYQIVLNAQQKAIEMLKPGVYFKDVHITACFEIAKGLTELGLMKGDYQEAVRNGAHALFFPHGLGHMMGLDVHDMEDIGEQYVGYDETVERSKEFGLAYLRFAKKVFPGYVLTVEPGIYFIPALIDMWKKDNKHADFINYDKVEKYKNFGGIRLEDDVLITNDGCKILGEKRIPIYIDDVENEVKKGLNI